MSITEEPGSTMYGSACQSPLPQITHRTNNIFDQLEIEIKKQE